MKRHYPRALIYEQLCSELLFVPLREEVRMGKHHDDDADGVADQTNPRTFTKDDGSTYERIPAAEIPDCDDVDSTTIVDVGAPE